jgi:hypothetical protein
MEHRVQRGVSNVNAYLRDVTVLMRKEFASAKLCWCIVVLLQLAALVVSIIALCAGDRAALLLASVGLLSPALTAWLRARAGTYHGRGEEVRRALLQRDGWGRKIDLSLVLVRVAMATKLPGWDSPPLGSYYNSTRPPGAKRVVQHLQQSAFFTTRHAETMCWVCGVVAVLVGFGGAAVIWISANGLQPFAHATDIGAALVAFAVGGDVLTVALSFQLYNLTRRANGDCVRCRSAYASRSWSETREYADSAEEAGYKA